MDGKYGGIAVHIGARVAAKAKPSEVLASSTVKDLVAGSGITFDDRGVQALKGVLGDWHLFSVACRNQSCAVDRPSHCQQSRACPAMTSTTRSGAVGA